MSKASITSTTPLSPDDLLLILACVSEVRITDREKEQRELYVRLARKLQKRAPQLYQDALITGAIDDWRAWSEEPAHRLSLMMEIEALDANRIAPLRRCRIRHVTVTGRKGRHDRGSTRTS